MSKLVPETTVQCPKTPKMSANSSANMAGRPGSRSPTRSSVDSKEAAAGSRAGSASRAQQLETESKGPSSSKCSKKHVLSSDDDFALPEEKGIKTRSKTAKNQLLHSVKDTQKSDKPHVYQIEVVNKPPKTTPPDLSALSDSGLAMDLTSSSQVSECGGTAVTRAVLRG